MAVALVGQQVRVAQRRSHLPGPLVGGGRVADGPDHHDRGGAGGRPVGYGVGSQGPVQAAQGPGAVDLAERRRGRGHPVAVGQGLLHGRPVVGVRAGHHGVGVPGVVPGAVRARGPAGGRRGTAAAPAPASSSSSTARATEPHSGGVVEGAEQADVEQVPGAARGRPPRWVARPARCAPAPRCPRFARTGRRSAPRRTRPRSAGTSARRTGPGRWPGRCRHRTSTPRRRAPSPAPARGTRWRRWRRSPSRRSSRGS